jgi:hypothetical protein
MEAKITSAVTMLMRDQRISAQDRRVLAKIQEAAIRHNPSTANSARTVHKA